MKRLTKTIGLLFLTAGAVLMSCTQVSAEVLNRVVAIVNDQVITLYELHTTMQMTTGLSYKDLRERSEETYLETRKKILDDLIDQKIGLEKIKELKIKVSEEEIDRAIEKVKEDNQLTQEDLVKELKRQGITYESYRETVREELERVQLINLEVKSKILLREEDIEEYYNTHRDEFTSEGRVRLALIFLKQQDPADKKEARVLHNKAREILSMIRNGEDFADLARKFSNGPGAAEGGDLGVFKMSELNPEMSETIKGLSAGQVSEPIIMPYGVKIIKVVEKEGGGEKSFEQVKNAIRAILYRKELDKKYSAWIKELRKKSYIKIVF
ncbi:MAG: peptidylprolyl isomerase [Deltaproteobacteria bacterium]|nr:peptidylprolyl isomerase [Deltaproteobacteria bacterium]MBW2046960.1 peptidylprolyl isomerase [Deltaproteobacteria bacterium]MBW2109881.1 peptidylprolyl isomerase [Deltaproteobacteria bacterium]